MANKPAPPDTPAPTELWPAALLRETEARSAPGFAKLIVAAQLFMAETTDAKQDDLGFTAERKSKMQILRNAFAEALNDLK